MVQVLTPSLAKVGPTEIEMQIGLCPDLPSLGSVNKSLQDLLVAEQQYTAQVSDIIRRDPSLTARLLRLVNSAYYARSTPVNDVEEAVFYVGVRQIQQLTTVTPVIEDFARLTQQCRFPWRQFWQHSIGTAILTREVKELVQAPMDESDYVGGLVHDVGKIVMAWAFPDHFAEIHRQALAGERELLDIENELLGIDHAELGALYLERHRLPQSMVTSARYHHRPAEAEGSEASVAAVQIADLLMRSTKIGCSGNYVAVTKEQCLAASGWRVFFKKPADAERALAKPALARSLERLPSLLEGLV